MYNMSTNRLSELQELCHHVGRKQFLGAIVEIFYRASDDTEHFEDKSLSEDYRNTATVIQNLIDDGTI